jgi:hypothetical protein
MYSVRRQHDSRKRADSSRFVYYRMVPLVSTDKFFLYRLEDDRFLPIVDRSRCIAVGASAIPGCGALSNLSIRRALSRSRFVTLSSIDIAFLLSSCRAGKLVVPRVA